jgi:hypothetical protein
LDASVALIWAMVPVSVTVPVPELAMVAVPPLTESVPLVTASVTVTVPVPASTSLTLRPVMARAESSVVVCGPGTVLTGASLTGLTVTVTLAVSVVPPELTV